MIQNIQWRIEHGFLAKGEWKIMGWLPKEIASIFLHTADEIKYGITTAPDKPSYTHCICIVIQSSLSYSAFSLRVRRGKVLPSLPPWCAAPNTTVITPT